MRAFLIAATLATFLAVGVLGGLLVDRQKARAEADRAEAPPSAPAPSPDVVDDEDDEEDEEAYIRKVLAERSLVNNCLVCHGEAMYASQRLTPAQWTAEIDKMLSWGATIPEDEREMVEEYLAKRYGPDSPPFVPDRMDLAAMETIEIPGDPRAGTEDVDPDNGARLFQALCATCHGPTAVGTELCPALANRAVLTHVEAYDKQVHEGLRRMPSMSAVLDAKQQRDILGWLRSLPYDQPPPPETPGS